MTGIEGSVPERFAAVAAQRLVTVMSHRLKGPAGPLALAQLANSVGDGAFYVTFALYFTRVVGLPATQFGLGVSVGWIAGFLAGVPIGHGADRWGPRRTAVAMALATAGAVTALMLARGYATFIVAVCAYAICQSGLGAARQALLAGLVEPARRTSVRAYLQSTTNGGLALGAALGGVALYADTPGAYLTILSLDAAAFLIAAVILSRLPEPPRLVAPATTGPALVVLRDRPYAVIALLNAVMLLYMPLLSWIIPLWIAQRTDAPRWMAAVVLALNTLSVMAFQVRMARTVTDLRTAARAVRRAGLLMLLACAVFALSAGAFSPWVIVAVLVVAAALQVVAEMAQAAGSWEISFDLAPPDRHGQYQGFFGSGVALARIIGPAALTTLIIAGGTLGWLALGVLFAVVSTAMGPAVRWAARERAARGALPQPAVGALPQPAVGALIDPVSTGTR